MLKELERGKTGPKTITPSGGRNSEYARALDQANTSTQEASRWQAVASLPDEVFDEAGEAPSQGSMNDG